MIKINAAGERLPNACFAIHVDAGNGQPGAGIAEICDFDNSDGSSSYELDPGNYVLIESRPPYGYGKAANRRFSITAGATKTITVTDAPLSQILIHAVDAQTGLPAKGGCYNLDPQTPVYPPQDYRSCDGFSPGEYDGDTTIGMVDRATYVLSEYASPYGYLPQPSNVVTVSTLNSIFEVTISYTKGATLQIHKVNDQDEAIGGASFRLFVDAGGGALGPEVGQASDSDQDGQLEITGIPTGHYVLVEDTAPRGYLIAPNVRVQLVQGETSEVTVTDPNEGVLLVSTKDSEGASVIGGCVYVYADAGGGTLGDPVASGCDFFDPGNPDRDGVIRVGGIPEGSFLLADPFSTFDGYLRPTNVPFTIAHGQTINLDLVYPLGGRVVIHVVDENDNPVSSACFARQVVDGSVTATSGNFGCDEADGSNDGTVTMTGFDSGNYRLYQWQVASNHAGADPIEFTIARDERKEITVQNPTFATLRVLKVNPDSQSLAGACFELYDDAGNGTPASDTRAAFACDTDDGNGDGTTTLAVPPGDYVVRESVVPAGFVAANDTAVQLDPAEFETITIIDPTPSTAVLRFIDVAGDPVRGICPQITSLWQCDGADGANDGTVTISGLRAGTWPLTFAGPLPGDFRDPQTQVVIGLMETTRIDIVLPQPAPVFVSPVIGTDITATSVILSVTTDQKAVAVLQFGLTDALGFSLSERSTVSTRTHLFQLKNLRSDTIYWFQVSASNANGTSTTEILRVRTNPSGSTGKLVIKKVKSDGTSLPGSCFDVYEDAGDGVLGDYVTYDCDAFEPDGNNGKITIPGLMPGKYVAAESSAPPRYKLAAPTRFTITAGQTKSITVTDIRGGVVLTVQNWSEINGPQVLDGCFEIYKDAGDGRIGDYVTWACDAYDNIDGFTTFSGIAPGNYVLYQSWVPDGYVRAANRPFTVRRGSSTLDLWVISRTRTDKGNIVARAVDADGNLLPGACFLLYLADSTSNAIGSFVASKCDISDGREDGLTYFADLEPGYYGLMEFIAPPGYVVGKKVAFTKVETRSKSVRFTNKSGGSVIKITTTRAGTSTKVKGACYDVYRSVAGRWEFLTWACDGWDGANDGITNIVGIPNGTYLVVQTVTPSGYRQPDYTMVTISGTGKTITVATRPR